MGGRQAEQAARRRVTEDDDEAMDHNYIGHKYKLHGGVTEDDDEAVGPHRPLGRRASEHWGGDWGRGGRQQCDWGRGGLYSYGLYILYVVTPIYVIYNYGLHSYGYG